MLDRQFALLGKATGVSDFCRISIQALNFGRIGRRILQLFCREPFHASTHGIATGTSLKDRGESTYARIATLA